MRQGNAMAVVAADPPSPGQRDCLAAVGSLTSILSAPTAYSRAARQVHIGRTGMSDIVGSGDFRYRIVENWAKLPDGWSFKEVAAVGVDSKDRVYAFNRGAHPMIVFDRTG